MKAECGAGFANLPSIYKKLKIQYKIFSFHLGLAALLTTVIVCGCTMLYLVIKQQHSIKQCRKHSTVSDSKASLLKTVIRRTMTVVWIITDHLIRLLFL